ncbi:alanine racemase [Lacisediminihabitans profunda]|uniref:alanine racemase n=1 Tax=Lacisediminihabitans profunda TaxID=2594790 RepID=UPI00164F846E|nr:alanine racemase C-terminal domain-containing protein [Lacisediminihabitans profunda]
MSDARMPGSAVCSAQVDLSAISDNAAVLAARVWPRLLAADLAADGYGHGAVESALAALRGGAATLAVSELDDARALRDAGITVDIVARRGLPSTGVPLAGQDHEVYSAGAALYGLVEDAELRPAMRVSALVVGTKTIEAGEGVSYGYTYRATTRTNLALVGIGYADGLDRIASNIGTLLLGGRARTIAGRVAMNALVLDLGGDTVRVGDEAVVFGDESQGEPTAAAWAAAIGRSAAEVASVFGRHLPRVTS